jgi:uroporphyrinogen decarboxylase
MCYLAHEYGLKVMMHSCGGIKPIIPFLISAGVDILDPIQTTAKDMAPEDLADTFGGKIIFHGGVDTQQLLPYGTPDEVINEKRWLIEVFTSKGGYIFAPGQVISKDVPLENILAMYNIKQ